MLLDRPIVRMPELAEGQWLNSAPLTKRNLHGRVVLVDFWDYSCINCIRTLPYMAEWHRRYSDFGLQIIGVHTPEFGFGQNRVEIQAAADHYGLTYPILLDNQYKNWDLYANKAWPTKYMIDSSGYIRYQRRGEGSYGETERVIQQLLLETDPGLILPPPLEPLRPQDKEGAVCYRIPNELHAGFAGGLFGGAMGNYEGYVPRQTVAYHLPQKREPGMFYVEGPWRARRESLDFMGANETSGRVVLPYQSAGVNAVLSPTSDTVDLMIGLWGDEDPLIQVLLNGVPVPQSEAGADIEYDSSGCSFVRVNRPRLYELVTHDQWTRGELTLVFEHHAAALYSFTFETCVQI